MGQVLGGENVFFLIRGRRAAHGQGGRASGILSIPAKEVSRGAHRVGTIHVQAPTPHAPPLQAFLAEISQHRARPTRRGPPKKGTGLASIDTLADFAH